MKRCLNCGTEISERDINCSNCGADVQNQKITDLFKNPKFMAIIAAVAALFIIIFLTILNTVIMPAAAKSNLQKAFDSKSGANVASVFEQYCGDYSVVYEDLSKSGKAVFSAFEDYISDWKDELNNQPTETDPYIFITDLTGDIFLPSADSALLRLSGYNEELYAAAMNFYNLYDSKEAFFQGTERMNKSDFQGAADLLEKVIEEDSWYSEAQNKLTEAQLKLMEEKAKLIEKFISEGRYEAAQDEITKRRNKNPTKEISEKLDTYETKIYEAKLAKIDEFVNSGDIDAANEYIESLGNGLSADAKERLNQAVKNKAVDYIAKADEVLKSGEREGAYDMAKMAQNLCPDDDEINKKVECFKEYLPFKLYYSDNATSYRDDDMWAYTGGIKWNEKLVSNKSETMFNCLKFYFNSDYKAHFDINYNLGKKYDCISGIAFLPEEYKNHQQNGYFEIYGDGKLLFKSENFSKNKMPNDFEVNITGIDMVTIKFFGNRIGDWLLGDSWTGFAVSNLIATKNLP